VLLLLDSWLVSRTCRIVCNKFRVALVCVSDPSDKRVIGRVHLIGENFYRLPFNLPGFGYIIGPSHKRLKIEGTSRARKSNENSSKKTRKSLEPQEGNPHNHECFHSLGGQILYEMLEKNLA
jgi:hypothetical protein